jgi:DNA polymerase-3 subunit delta'
MQLISQVIITSLFEETIDQLRSLAQENERFEVIRPDEGKSFQVKDAKLAIEKAYIASYEKKIIVLISDTFSDVVQNKLLKVIEEPPENTEFVLMLSFKSTLLPTIISRLPVVVLDEDRDVEPLELDMNKLDVRSVYEFVQKHIRTDANKAKKLLEQIANAAVRSGQYRMDEKTLDLLKDSRLALDKGSPSSFILIGALLKLLAKKKKQPR